MPAQAAAPFDLTQLVNTASNLSAGTKSAAKIAGAIPQSFPANFEPGGREINLGLCCRLMEWALLETGYALETLKESKTLHHSVGNYLAICDEQQLHLHACLATTKAVCELMPHTSFDYERLLLAGLIPDLDEQMALFVAIRTAAEAARSWQPQQRPTARKSTHSVRA